MVTESFAGKSWITNVEYDTETEKMRISIKNDGNTYECQDVPYEVFAGFRDAPSKGQYFNMHIRGQYNHEWFE